MGDRACWHWRKRSTAKDDGIVDVSCETCGGHERLPRCTHLAWDGRRCGLAADFDGERCGRHPPGRRCVATTVQGERCQLYVKAGDDGILCGVHSRRGSRMNLAK